MGSRAGWSFSWWGPHSDAVVESVEKRGLSDVVRLIGPVPYDRVPSYVNACDILVAPYNILGTSRRSKGIGSPLKVLEYMACGKPTIGSNLPQVADLIEDGKTGLLFPQGDARSLAKSITMLADDPRYRQQFGRSGSRLRQERVLMVSPSGADKLDLGRGPSLPWLARQAQCQSWMSVAAPSR